MIVFRHGLILFCFFAVGTSCAFRQSVIPAQVTTTANGPAVDWIQHLISSHFFSHSGWPTNSTPFKTETWDTVPLPDIVHLISSSTNAEYEITTSEYDYEQYHFPVGRFKLHFNVEADGSMASTARRMTTINGGRITTESTVSSEGAPSDEP